MHMTFNPRLTLARALMLAVLAAASGCYKATFIQPKTVAGVEHDEWTDFFVFGIVGEEQRDISGYCSTDVARVRTGGNFATGLVSFLTLGIYTPRKVYVTCTANAAASASTSTQTEQAP
jgi:hypothetical protein